MQAVMASSEKVMSENDWKSQLIDYYNSLEIMLAYLRATGEYRTHFGLADRDDDAYCFIKACAMKERYPAAYDFLGTSMDTLHERLFRPFPFAPGSQVLDVGCGCGGTLRDLASEWGDVRFQGINLNPTQFRTAVGLLAGLGNVELLFGDFFEYPFELSYDLVYFIESVFHMHDKAAVVDRLAAITRPGGWVYMVDIFLPDALYLRLGRRGGSAEPIFHYLSVECWRKLLEARGFVLSPFEDLSEEASRTIAIRTSPEEFRREVVASRYGATGQPALAAAAEKVYAGYRRLHRMLNQGQARYGVLRARKDDT